MQSAFTVESRSEIISSLQDQQYALYLFFYNNRIVCKNEMDHEMQTPNESELQDRSIGWSCANHPESCRSSRPIETLELKTINDESLIRQLDL